MKKPTHIILPLLMLALVSCAQKDNGSKLLGSWDYASQVSDQQAAIIAEHEQKEPEKKQEFSNYQLEITGEQVFADDGSYKNQSLIRIELPIVISTIRISYRLQEQGNWNIKGDTITMVPTHSKVQPEDDVTRLFSLANRNFSERLKSPKQGRTMRIVAQKENSLQLEYHPEAKVLIALKKKQ